MATCCKGVNLISTCAYLYKILRSEKANIYTIWVPVNILVVECRSDLIMCRGGKATVHSFSPVVVKGHINVTNNIHIYIRYKGVVDSMKIRSCIALRSEMTSCNIFSCFHLQLHPTPPLHRIRARK